MKKLLGSLLLVMLLLTGCNSAPVEDYGDDIYVADADIIIDKDADVYATIAYGEFSLDDIPEYTGTPYIIVNDNVPYFTDEELSRTEAFEEYAELDVLGRCGAAFANVCRETQPTEERGSIGQIKPSGWHTVKYNGYVEGNYLYNRCHLIGFQLTGENANELNLITGTRYMNCDGQLPFENEIDDYVDETGNHVLYRVTPIYEGDNLVASGVLTEAYSIEDDDCRFCVYIYNVQPGIAINYANGESCLMEDYNGQYATETYYSTGKVGHYGNDEIDPNQSSDNIESENIAAGDCTYVLNTNSMKFHVPDCASVGKMSDSNKKYSSESRDALCDQGYEPCGACNP